MKQITKKQWISLQESDRKLILRHVFPNMIEYYENIKNTTNESKSHVWDMIQSYTKYDKKGRICVRGVFPGNIKVQL